MKAATVREIKQELKTRSSEDLVELCLRLSKFKKENKELLTYLLYEAENEDAYINSVKEDIEEEFSEISSASIYRITKSVRKILRNTKKYIRYSKNKETEVALLIHFSSELKNKTPVQRSTVLQNILDRQILAIRKVILTLHEDLQYDYNIVLNEI